MNPIANLTARRSNGQEYQVEVFASPNGIYGKISNQYVSFDVVKSSPVVMLSEKTAKELLNVDAKNGGALELTSDWRLIRDAYKKEQETLAMGANIIGFVYRLGCDAGDQVYFVYDFPENLSSDARWKRISSDERLANSLTWKQVGELAERIGAKKLEADGMSYGGYEFDASNIGELLAAAGQRRDTTQTEKAAKEAAAQKNRDKKFTEAKNTGKSVILESYSVECNDPDEECTCDIVTVYAQPDGTEKSSRSHTY